MANQRYDRYLLAVPERGIALRQKNRQPRLIKAAHPAVLKQLADFSAAVREMLATRGHRRPVETVWAEKPSRGG